MRRVIITLALQAMFLLPAVAQRDTCQAWVVSQVDGVRSAGSISNVSCIENRIYFHTSGTLFSIAPTYGAVAEADTVYAPLDREMNYVAQHPTTGQVYYTKRVGKRSQLYEIYLDEKGQRRSRQVKLPHFKGTIVHPTFSADGQLMVFSSNDEAGRGGFDLWYCRLGINGWQDPVNLGPHINTGRHEFSPTLWGDFLFFSSDRDSTRDDFDIYATRLLSTSNLHGDTLYPFPIGLSPVQLMPAPLNSDRNDFGVAFPSQGQGIYFVSRPDPLSTDRLYRIPASVHCVSYQGTALHAETLEPLPFATLTALTPEGKRAFGTRADSLGRFTLYLPTDTTILVRTSAAAHLSLTEPFHTQPASLETLLSAWSYTPTLSSFPLHKKIPIQAQTLFGTESGSDLTSEGEEALREAIRFCRENPQLKLTITAVYGRHKRDSFCAMLNRTRLQTLLHHLSRQGVRATDVDTRSTVGSYRRTSTDNATFDNVILLQFD